MINKKIQISLVIISLVTICTGVWNLISSKHEQSSETFRITTGKSLDPNHLGVSQERSPKSGIARSTKRADNKLIRSITECIERKNRGELVILLERVDKSQFEEVWNLLGGIGNERAADELRNRLLVRVGSSMEIHEMLALIKGLTGSGTIRNSFIETTFGVSRMSILQLMDAVSQLNEAQERASAYRGMARKISYMENLDDIGLAVFSGKLSPEMLETIVSGLGKYHYSGLLRKDMEVYQSRAADAINFSVRAVSSGIAEDGLVAQVVTEMAKNMPFPVWEALNISFPDLMNDGKIVSSVLWHMSYEKPFETMEIAASKNSIDSNLLTRAIARDNSRVEEWYLDNMQDLSESQRDVFAEVFSTERAKSHDFEDAYDWVKKIENPAYRLKAEGVIWTAERDLLRKEVNNEPAGTLQSIISGQSKYTDYWLEEAMSTWVAMDFDKAQDWYQKNWKSISANKSQYIAAAFAKQAAGAGGVTAAREWAAHIRDTKTRQRVDAVIDKAAGQESN
jgi:hypothetical protein